MPPCHRVSDLNTGVGCFPPVPLAVGCGTVFADKLQVATTNPSHLYIPHCCGPVCHPCFGAVGSGTVFAEKFSVTRIGDPVVCGSFVMLGSPDVNVGG